MQPPMAKRASRSGLTATLARASVCASEAPTCRVHAGGHLDRNEECPCGLVHLSLGVLREMTHETGDCGEATPRALAVPTVDIPAERPNRTSQRRPRVTESRGHHPQLSRSNARGVRAQGSVARGVRDV